MARGINVRIAVPVVIERLEKKHAELTKKVADNEKILATNEKLLTAWAKELDKIMRKNPSKVSISASYHHGSKTYQVSMTMRIDDAAFPSRPELLPTEPMWGVREDIVDIEEALTLLRLTDDTTVSTTTYRNLSKFIS